MLSSVSLLIHEAMAIKSQGLNIGITFAYGAIFLIPLLLIVEINTTGILALRSFLSSPKNLANKFLNLC